MPRVSICIPVYNGRPYVAETIASVRAQLFDDWELIVTENGSSDGSHELVEELLTRTPDARVRYQRYPSATGLPADWNRALSLASGELFKLLPCDDRLDRDCLRLQVAALDRTPEAGFVTCARRIIDARGRSRLPVRPRRDRGLSSADGRKALLSGGHNPLGEPVCGLVRRDLVDQIGDYDTRFRYYPDLDFWCRALTVRPGIRLGRALCDFRVHGGTQSTALRDLYAVEYAELVKHHADRFQLTKVERLSAKIRAKAVARARSAVIRWLLA